ncbi:MAG: hypothetical protein PHC28_13620 [Flavobacterium sp.]|uniref:hypothetical protein n=1 Tax=Flavobacterium sp. TaxID=239 RepID=UPI00263279CF|nr:hypothetical protein [Flavobacterium sp.]MDD5151491.1 hypothetical protein [Flavobacterium sp.]
MIKQLVILFFFVCSLQSFSQKLVYKSNGTILNSENQKISPDQVRELLANSEKLLADYNAGRTKKTIGNILLIGGFGLLTTDVLVGASTDGNTTVSGNTIQSDRNYPSALTYVGLAALVVAIPVKIGFSKKIKNVVTDYNNQLTTGYNKPKLDIITNSNGLGLRFTLN